MSVNDLILALDDPTAERILTTIARHRLQPAPGTVTTLTPRQADVLATEIGANPSTAPATQGNLARATLLMLAADPDRRPEVEALVNNPAPQKYAVDPITATLLTTAALVALQTYVKIEYDGE